MAKLYRKMLLLAIKETTPGTEEVPTVANVMLVRGLQPQPITAEYVGRDNIKPYMGNNSQLAAGIHRTFEFEMEMAGSGTAGVAPAWGVLLEGCGFDESTNAGSPGEVHYSPISESIPSLTMYVYLDGILMKMIGSLGTVVFDFTSKTIPVMRFRFIGDYSVMTDTAFPTGVDYSAFIAPVTVGKVFTPSFTIHNVAACMQSLVIDMANQLVYRDLVGCGGAIISNRAPTATTVFELTSVAAKNWGEVIKNSTEGTLSLTHGRVAGNIITVDLPVVTCNNAGLQEQDGVAMVNTSLTVNPNVGNDEILITVQ